MKLKTLKKKVRRLEIRLREGPKKLAQLKRKLDALQAAKARKTQKKAAAKAVARQTAKPLPAKKKAAAPAPAKKPAAPAKQKRKLNISPERRAELSAAMKARWAAKRAASEANGQSGSVDQGSAQQ